MKEALAMSSLSDLPAQTSSGTPSRPPVTRTHWLALPFRLIITAEAVVLFDQAVFAGQFLSGTFAALQTHRENAGIAAIGMLVAGIAAVPLHWVKPGVLWEPLACLGIFGLIALQITLGFNHVLTIHIPLGVTIITLAVFLALHAWRPLPSPQRGTGTPSPSTEDRA